MLGILVVDVLRRITLPPRRTRLVVWLGTARGVAAALRPLVQFGVVGGLRAPGACHAGRPTRTDVLLEPHLAAQVGEIADEHDVDRTVYPPQRGHGDTRDDSRGEGREQHQQHHALPERVARPRGQRSGLGVEPATACAIAGRGALPGAVVGVRLVLRCPVGLVLRPLGLTRVVLVRRVVEGVVGHLGRIADLVRPQLSPRARHPDLRPACGGHPAVPHSVGSVSLTHPVNLLTLAPGRPRQHPPGERCDAGSRHLLAMPRDRGDEDQQPEHNEAREDHRARHGCLLPPRRSPDAHLPPQARSRPGPTVVSGDAQTPQRRADAPRFAHEPHANYDWVARPSVTNRPVRPPIGRSSSVSAKQR